MASVVNSKRSAFTPQAIASRCPRGVVTILWDDCLRLVADQDNSGQQYWVDYSRNHDLIQEIKIRERMKKEEDEKNRQEEKRRRWLDRNKLPAVL